MKNYVKAVPIIKDCAARNLIWLGWFHSHPFRGDSIYMSQIDIGYHFIQQGLNPFWTALVLNPHQIHNSTTTHGIRAFRLQLTADLKVIKTVVHLSLNLIK